MRLKSIFIIIALVLGCLFIGTADLNAQGKYLNVGERIQEHSNWCWAGTSQCILYYRGYYPSQCAIVNYAWGRNDCCGNTNFNWNHNCNQPNGMYGGNGDIQDILYNWGTNSYGGYYSLYWSTCKTEINNDRPFIMRFGWTGGGGHFLTVYGYWVSSGTDYLGYMDPWPNEGYTWSTYNWTVSSSNHNWTHTLRLN